VVAVATHAFWISLTTLVYIFGGFGLLVGILGFLRRRGVRKAPITPKVTLIIAAYNEERGIRKKLLNTLELDYPPDLLEIIVGSDGSDDRTEAIVAEFRSKGVELLSLSRRGKIFVLNEAVAEASGEVLLFSDANTLYQPDAVRMLVRNFADPEVGGVCGNQKHLDTMIADSSSEGEGLYWRYDKWLKAMESGTGSIVSADGAMYAIRRDLYREPESAAVTDDFYISTGVIGKGFRLVFESEAIGYEPTTGTAGGEFRRKVRIMNRGLNGVYLRRRLLNPFRYGFYSIVLFSHKVLRRLAPVFLLIALASSLVLAPSAPFFLAAALTQSAFYVLALAGFGLRATRLGQKKILSTPFFFCLANAAALVATGMLVRGRRIEQWQPRRQGVTA
jgi:cellulose synthase/poly-beta-1,6-N-acetylglucosamine synthase-like glycosyltransferase